MFSRLLGDLVQSPSNRKPPFNIWLLDSLGNRIDVAFWESFQHIDCYASLFAELKSVLSNIAIGLTGPCVWQVHGGNRSLPLQCSRNHDIAWNGHLRKISHCQETRVLHDWEERWMQRWFGTMHGDFKMGWCENSWWKADIWNKTWMARKRQFHKAWGTAFWKRGAENAKSKAGMHLLDYEE